MFLLFYSFSVYNLYLPFHFMFQSGRSISSQYIPHLSQKDREAKEKHAKEVFRSRHKVFLLLHPIQAKT